MMYRRLVFGTLIALLCLPALTGISRDTRIPDGNVPLPPPEPNPLEVEVPRGGPVWITLSAYSLTSPIIRYRIKREARDGKLGTPQLVTADTGVVKYTPPAGFGPGDDNFSYQVQSEGGVSAAAEVHIKLTDKDPHVVAPDELDFGEVLPGGSSRRILVMQNIGGGLAQGEVRVPVGWVVEGDPVYSLAAGAKQNFTLVFKPTEERAYTGDVEYTGDQDRATDLVGKEVPPIAVAPGPIEMAEAGSTRMGTIHIENRTDSACTLRVTPGPGVKADASVVVPPKGAADLLVQVTPGKDGEVHDVVTVEGEGIKVDVPVHAAPMRRIAIAPTVPAGLQAATVTKAAPVAASVHLTAPQAVAVAGNEAPLPDMTLPPLDSDSDGLAPPVRSSVCALGVRMAGDDKAQLLCIFRGTGSGVLYRVETRTVGIDPHGRPETRWGAAGNVTVYVNGQSVTADMAHLHSNALYVVRIVALDPQGKVVALSSTSQIWTPAAKPVHWGWVLLGVVVLLAGGAAWRWRKRFIR